MAKTLLLIDAVNEEVQALNYFLRKEDFSFIQKTSIASGIAELETNTAVGIVLVEPYLLSQGEPFPVSGRVNLLHELGRYASLQKPVIPVVLYSNQPPNFPGLNGFDLTIFAGYIQKSTDIPTCMQKVNEYYNKFRPQK